MGRGTKLSTTEMPDGERPAEAAYQTRALARGLALLSHFSVHRPEISLTELAELAELDKSTTLRLLRNLEQYRFLARDDGTGRYRLGLKVFELAAAFHGSQWLVQAAQPVLESLAQRCQQTAELGILDGGEIVTLAIAYPSRPLRRHVSLGERFPATCTSIGRMLLADRPTEQVAAFLERYPPTAATPRAITAPDHLIAEIAAAAGHGYALDDGETVPGVSCIAAPVRDGTGRAVAAISVSGPSAEFQARRRQDYIEEVTAMAKAASANLGYPADSQVGREA